MRKRYVPALLVGCVMSVNFAGVASASEPVGGCPRGGTNVPHPEGGGWNLVELAGAVDQDVGNLHDQNADGYICQRFVIGLSDKHDFGVWAVKDNTHAYRGG